MNKVEIKSRVDFRLKPLLVKGVRVIYKKSEFSITEYDFFDNIGKYVINVSDRVDPFELDLNEIQHFINALKRKDKIEIPPFEVDATKAEQPEKTKRKLSATIEDGNEEEPPLDIQEIEVDSDQPAQPKRSGKYVHIESVVKVYVTRDYSLFSILQGNRSLNKIKIKRIKAEIAAGTNLLQYCPIIVVEKDGKLKVIDGQHRLEVAKQIGSNVWYVISNELTLYEIAKMNSNTEKWTGKDYINCYAHTGNGNYITLKEFTTVYGFPLTVNLQMLTRGVNVGDGSGETLAESFQQGLFRVTTEAKAIEIAQLIHKFSEFTCFKTRPFIIAVCKIIIARKIGLDEVIKAYEAHKDQLVQQSSWKDYLFNLETIINIGKSKRRVIY